MEFQKIANFLDTTPDDKDLPRFVTKKRIEVRDQSGENYSVNKEIRIKTSMLRSDLCNFSDYVTEYNDSLTKAKVVIPLKHLSDFWRALHIPLINCEVELILTWSKNCVLAYTTVNATHPAIVAPSGVTFKINDTKLHVSVVTLSKENDAKLLEQLKPGFKRIVKWNKYRSEITV